MELIKIKGEDGKEHEVYSAADVETYKQQLTESHAATLTPLQVQLKAAEDALAKAKETDKDFAGLREAKEKAEKLLKDAETGHAAALEAAENRGKVLVHKDNLIKLFAKDAPELEKLITKHMSDTLKAMPENTKEEIEAKMKMAVTLAVGKSDEGHFKKVISSAGGGAAGGTEDIKSDLKEMGKKYFGLTDKDWENAKTAGLI